MARIQMDLRNVLLEIHRALDEAGIAHALIGGLALAAYGAGRATADLDLLADGERADDVDRILREHGYECLLRNQYVANYLGPTPERGRVDFLFARRPRGRAILDRAMPHTVAGASLRVVDASDLIGLKVQSLSNDPSRRHQDRADIERLLGATEVDLERVLPALRSREGARRAPLEGAASMSGAHEKELEEFRDDALSEEAQRAFRASAEAIARWERTHPLDLDAILDWIDQLRQVFGDAPPDRRPCCGNDFRL